MINRTAQRLLGAGTLVLERTTTRSQQVDRTVRVQVDVVEDLVRVVLDDEDLLEDEELYQDVISVFETQENINLSR